MPDDTSCRIPDTDLDLFASAGDGLTPEHFGIDGHGNAFVEAPAFAKALGYSSTQKAAQQVDDDEKGQLERLTLGGQQIVTVFYEDGIWELIFRSTLPSAKRVKAKVKAILRQLRETGLVDMRQKPMTELEMARKYVAALERLDAMEQEIHEQAPLVAQAKAHRAGARDISRQDFAREVVKWALQEHSLRVYHRQVFAFLDHLGLFIKPGRGDSGQATTEAIIDGLADNAKGTTDGGFNYATGKLTPKGQGYAWDRIARYIEANGTLELPRQIGA